MTPQDVVDGLLRILLGFGGPTVVATGIALFSAKQFTDRAQAQTTAIYASRLEATKAENTARLEAAKADYATALKEQEGRQNQALERLKSDLRAGAYRGEVQFVRIFEKRAEIFGELYSRVVKAETFFASYINPMQLPGDTPLDRKAQLAVESANELIQYFSTHALWLDEELESEAKTLVDTLTLALSGFQAAGYAGPPPAEAWMNAMGTATDQLPPLRKALQHRIRLILGIVQNEQAVAVAASLIEEGSDHGGNSIA